ncbi:stalk domain-containing protein [Paenibacillus sp. GCM10027627]|uniref:stalk domain-containing protein n=1 Tax=unclassified Paenibacillus TaxID=185978 RepID=UPI00362E6C61
MKWRKVAALILLLSLCGSTVIFANAAVQKVRVLINGAEQDDGGIVFDGKTYLPLRQVADSLLAIVNWDNASKRATIYKPNVHMFLYKGNSPFGVVDKGFQGKIKVFAQVDNLQTNIEAVKVSIADPGGKERSIESKKVPRGTKDIFWFVSEEFDYKFDSAGQYTVRFYVQLDGSDDWSAVSEKVVTSRNP